MDMQVPMHSPFEIGCRVLDVSHTGIKIRTKKPMEPGTKIGLEIFSGSMLAQGQVRWLHTHADGFTMGIQFDQIDSIIIEKVMRTQNYPV